MGRRKSVAQIEKDLLYAKNLAAYKPPVREEGGSPRKLPRIGYAYKPMAIAVGETAKKYTVQASKKSVDFFTEASLNLTDAAALEGLPRGAKPSKIHVTVADDTPTILKALGSKRPYIRYGKGTRGGKTQYTYTAPISIQSASAIDNEVKAVFTAVKDKLGGAYGRLWFTPEVFVLSFSGE